MLVNPNFSKTVIEPKRNVRIPIADIILLEGDSNYTNFIINHRKKQTFARSLIFFEAELLKIGFIRIHRSCLVNPSYIRQKDFSQSMITLNDGTELTVARRRLKAVFKDLKKALEFG